MKGTFIYMYTSIKQFYSSKAWQNCRASYISWRKGLCERCLAKGIIKPGDEVHHKKRLSLDNINDSRVTLNYSNLELLCKECHYEEHSSDRTNMFSKKRYVIDQRTGAVLTRDTPPEKGN